MVNIKYGDWADGVKIDDWNNIIRSYSKRKQCRQMEIPNIALISSLMGLPIVFTRKLNFDRLCLELRSMNSASSLDSKLLCRYIYRGKLYLENVQAGLPTLILALMLTIIPTLNSIMTLSPHYVIRVLENCFIQNVLTSVGAERRYTLMYEGIIFACTETPFAVLCSLVGSDEVTWITWIHNMTASVISSRSPNTLLRSYMIPPHCLLLTMSCYDTSVHKYWDH